MIRYYRKDTVCMRVGVQHCGHMPHAHRMPALMQGSCSCREHIIFQVYFLCYI